MKNFTEKLRLGLLVIFFIFLFLSVVSIAAISEVINNQHKLLSANTQELLLARDLRNLQARHNALIPIFVLSGKSEFLIQVNDNNKAFNKTLAELSGLINSGDAIAILHTIKAQKVERSLVDQKGIDMRLKGASIELINRYFSEIRVQRLTSLKSSLDNFVSYTTSDYNKAKNSNSLLSITIIRFLSLAFGLALLLLSGITLLFIRLIKQKNKYDQTQILLMQKEKQLSVARKEAIEVVAHDLKSPLSAILMSSQLLEDFFNEHTTIRQKKISDIIHSSAGSMKHLIDNLLDQAKIDSGNLILVKKPCKVDSFLSRLTDQHKIVALNKNISFDFLPPAFIPGLICIDEGRMEQVISNIIGNALKFTAPGGSVVFSYHLLKDNIVFCVKDTGRGMSAAQVERIFERYWQVREHASQGTGLGMAISKAIVDAHNGEIWVESEQGKGSAFYVKLPCNLGVRNAVGAADEPINYNLAISG